MLQKYVVQVSYQKVKKVIKNEENQGCACSRFFFFLGILIFSPQKNIWAHNISSGSFVHLFKMQAQNICKMVR